jgi:hypothetical protein
MKTKRTRTNEDSDLLAVRDIGLLVAEVGERTGAAEPELREIVRAVLSEGWPIVSLGKRRLIITICGRELDAVLRDVRSQSPELFQWSKA